MSEKDYTDLSTVTPTERFSASLSEVRLEFDRKHLPYDEQCARLEFKDKLDQAEKESERRHGFIKMEDISVEYGNLDKYGDASRFVFVSEQPHMQDRVIEGSRTQVLTGYQRDYRCKARGHGISVFIPVADYKPLEKVKDKDKDKKEE